MFLNFNTLLAQGQTEGISKYRFSELTIAVFDETTNNYKETSTEKMLGIIIMNNISGTVTIETDGKKKKFKLIGTTIEPDTFRTLYQLRLNDENFILAESVRYFTLIGTTERIIYKQSR